MADVYLGSDGSNWNAATWWDVAGNPTSAPTNGDKVFLNSKSINLNVSTPELAGLYAGRAEDYTGTGYVMVTVSGLTLHADTIKAGTIGFISINSASVTTLNVVCDNAYAGANNAFQLQGAAHTLNVSGHSGGNANIYAINGNGINTGTDYNYIVNVTGNIYGSTTNASKYGALGRGTLTVVGTIYAGSQTSAHGAIWRGTLSTTNVQGNASSAYGITQYGSTTLAITVTGYVLGGAGTSHGICLTYSGCSIIVGGSVTGGSESGARGISIANYYVAPFTLNGAVIGGTGYAVYYGGTSTITVNNNVTGAANTAIYSAANAPIIVTGNVTGGTSGSYACGIVNGTGKIIVDGHVTGGSAGNASGIYNSSTAMIVISGNVTGGTVDVTANAVYSNSSIAWVFYGGTKTNDVANAFNSETYVRQGVIAKIAGNWNTGSNWYGGSVPTAGQNVVLNGLSMTFDIASTTVADVYGQGSTGQIVFDVTGGNKSFTANNVYAGTNTGGCIRVSGANGNTFTFSCSNIYGGTGSGAGLYTTAGAYAVIMSGNVYGGSSGLTASGVYLNTGITLTGTVRATPSSYAIYIGANNLTVNITGNCYGGESSTNYLYCIYVYNATNITLNIWGNCYGGGGAGYLNCVAHYYNQSDTSVITINGSLYASSTASLSGGCAIRLDGKQTLNVIGNCYSARYSDTLGHYAIYCPYYATSDQIVNITGNLIGAANSPMNVVAAGAMTTVNLNGDIYCSSKAFALGSFKAFNWTKTNGKLIIVANGETLTFVRQLAESEVKKGVVHGDRTGQLAFRREKINA